jgi:hypothetical protein
MADMGRPLKFESVEQLQEKINAYFVECDEKNEPYTITGLAVFLDCDRDTLLNYEKKSEDFFGTIKRAKDKCLAYAEKSLWQVKNPAGIIFNLKANYGWQDTQKIDVNLTGDAATALAAARQRVKE